MAAADMYVLLEKMASRGNMSLHVPREVDDMVAGAYTKLIGFKMEMDQMHEMPPVVLPLYKETMKAMDALRKAGKHTYQLRMMTARAARHS